MKAEDWRSFFSPQEWAVFNREAARRGLSPDDLAAKYLCRAVNRMELAKKYGPAQADKLSRSARQIRPPTTPSKPPPKR